MIRLNCYSHKQCEFPSFSLLSKDCKIMRVIFFFLFAFNVHLFYLFIILDLYFKRQCSGLYSFTAVLLCVLFFLNTIWQRQTCKAHDFCDWVFSRFSIVILSWPHLQLNLIIGKVFKLVSHVLFLSCIFAEAVATLNCVTFSRPQNLSSFKTVLV